MRPTVASLFSGCGGFDLGFMLAGYEPTAAFDLSPSTVDTYNKNVAPVARVEDLSTSTPTIPVPDVLLAGSPCQGFSTSGLRALNDPRNELLRRAAEIAITIGPRVFILENVPAAASGEYKAQWSNVEKKLQWHGYNIGRLLADGMESGLAQRRRRLFLIAWKGDGCVDIRPDIVPAQSLRDVLRGVESLPDHEPIDLPSGSREALIAARIGPGKKLSNVRVSASSVHTWDIPEVFGSVSNTEILILNALVRLRRRNRRRSYGDADPVHPATLEKHMGGEMEPHVLTLLRKGYLRKVGRYIDLRHTYNGKFRRLEWDSPSPTVDTHFADPGLFLHPTEHRGMTAREAARIQGFPDSFRWDGSKASRIRMIGNAVPPPMAKRLANFVLSALL